MRALRRLVTAILVAVLLTVAAYGVGWATRPGGELASVDDRARPRAQQVPAYVAPAPAPQGSGTSVDSLPSPSPDEVLLSAGDRGPKVRSLQARLAQLDWFLTDLTGRYDDHTVEAVRGFQVKRGFPANGDLDRRTWRRLLSMSTVPTAAELVGLNGNTPGPLDARCNTGRVICADKTTQTLRWVVDGRVLKTVDTRFGMPGLETREGEFEVYFKNRDHVSRLYDVPMPFAMFFSRGQAVHYSSDFAAVGYNGGSHGCVNIRDYDAVAWLFDQVQVGDQVVVYRS